VTFNYRYAPAYTRFRQLVMEGAVGQPLAVDFSWMLDTSHGADYFRRWHREKENSGGLLVHKATHHFDLVNWWIDSYPQHVFAMGDLLFYGRDNAKARGQQYPYERYTGVAEAANDPFALFLNENEVFRGLYLDAKQKPLRSGSERIWRRSQSRIRWCRSPPSQRCDALYCLIVSPGKGCVAITGTKGASSWKSPKHQPSSR
jgi:hypothetical protein